MKALIKKIISQKVINFYHFLISSLATRYFNNPSDEMVVIGVTGTKGKSTVVNLVGKMLAQADFKVGWITSVNVRIGKKTKPNPWNMTMPGRFMLQRSLRKMADANCDYVVIEVTSEGIKQWRHRGINFDTVCFTNISPEHIKAHGSFENYKQAKGKIFKNLVSKKRKKLPSSPYLGKVIPKIIVANHDDSDSDYFLGFDADKKFTFGIEKDPKKSDQSFVPKSYEVSGKGIKFRLDSTTFSCSLLGRFNLYNILGALTIARAHKIDFVTIKKALAQIEEIPGRMEFIDQGQDFEVVVDFAHTPDSFQAVLETIKRAFFVVSGFKDCICVFGSAGGGRDQWKRPKLGKIASEYCDKIVLTTDDPYKEDPQKIAVDIKEGIDTSDTEVFEELDRRKAIRKAFRMASKDDIVLLLGKGSERVLPVDGEKIDWDDREVAREELQKIMESS